MPDFKYQGTNRSGSSVSGVMTANSKADLQNLLRRQQITPTKMSEKGKEFNMPTFGGGVNAKELAIFTRQFSVMIDAGLPLVQCLEILGNQQENKFFQKVLINTRSMVESGSTLSTAMRSSPKVFDGLYVNMVEAGETGGILDIILQRLSTYIEKNVKLQRAVKSALVYPVGVLTIAGLVIFLLLWKVVPSRCHPAPTHKNRYRHEQFRGQLFWPPHRRGYHRRNFWTEGVVWNARRQVCSGYHYS
jgi:type IV pilus assembly protein PilC